MESEQTAPAIRDRFFAKVDITPGCWTWTASTRDGYGMIWSGGKRRNGQMREIRLRRGEGELLRTIAADFGVSQGWVSKVAKGEARGAL